MKTRLHLAAFALALGVGAFGCANKPPSQELLSARSAYEEASRGPAAKLEVDRLLEAKQALDTAEKWHNDDAQSLEEKHFAYIAERVANMAHTYGKVAMNLQAKVNAESDKDKTSESRRTKAEGQVVKTQAELDAERVKLAAEKEARMKAEASLRSALAALAEFAKMKEEPRGLVITLNGSVLFETNKSALLPAAQKRLDEVAKALADLQASQTMVVEGHTDSQGADDANVTLSQSRAQSVRDYLVSRGVPTAKITAMGKGEGTPVADNNSAEGRANNRRVEIIISPPK